MLLLKLFALGALFASSKPSDHHFNGGAISFKFIDTSTDIFKLKLTVITGWKLGQGPCGPNCTLEDVGRSTRASRNQVLIQNGNEYLGNWKSETRKPDNNTDFFHHGGNWENLTIPFSSNITGVVAAVNVPMMWEQELAEIITDVDSKTAYKDISLVGSYWRHFDYDSDRYENKLYSQYINGLYWIPYRNRTRGSVSYYLQIKIRPGIRSDTGKPNNSPVAMFKPVYKFPLNSVSTITFSTEDEDNDLVFCMEPQFVELGHLNIAPNVTINKNCTIEVKTFEKDGFKDGGYGVIAVRISDYNREDITIGGTDQHPGGFSTRPLSQIPVQFMIQTVRQTKAPMFVDPTPDSQHKFTVYAGSTLNIVLYAKPFGITFPDVKSFHMRSVPSKVFTVQSPSPHLSRSSENVKYTTVTWRSGTQDLGRYVLGALVTDESGTDGLDRNYELNVKAITFRSSTPSNVGAPYFAFFPEDSVIACLQNSTCFFPVYSAVNTSGYLISEVRQSKSTSQDIKISSPTKTLRNGLDVFLTDISFTSNLTGWQPLCLHAIDNSSAISSEECLIIKMEYQDACKSFPCMNKGRCIQDEGSFTCICQISHSGPVCEYEIDYCASQPCLNEGECYNIGLVPPYICSCAAGYTGQNCEQVIQKPTTSSVGPSSLNGATVKCNKYQFCQIPLSVPSDSTGSPALKVGLFNLTDPPVIKEGPTPDPVHPGLSRGILEVHPTSPGLHHVCAELATGHKEETICLTIDVKSGTGFTPPNMVPFLDPTLPDKSSLQCYGGVDCHVIVYTKPSSINTCPGIGKSGSSGIKVRVFLSEINNSTKPAVCTTDLMFNPGPNMTDQACIDVENGPKRTIRCFNVNFNSEPDPCSKKNCNNGSCLPNGSVALCICERGFSAVDDCYAFPTNIMTTPTATTATTTRSASATTSPTSIPEQPCRGVRTKNPDKTCSCSEGVIGANCDIYMVGKVQHSPKTIALLHSLDIDAERPHIIGPTKSNGLQLECEQGKACIIPVTVFSGLTSPLLEVLLDDKPYSDISLSSGAPTGEKLKMDIVLPKPKGKEKHCISLKSADGQISRPWCIMANEVPDKQTTKKGISLSSLPSGSIIPCFAGDTCSIPIVTHRKNRLTIDSCDVSCAITTNPTDPSRKDIVVKTGIKDLGPKRVCIDTSQSTEKKCYVIRVTRNPVQEQLQSDCRVMTKTFMETTYQTGMLQCTCVDANTQTTTIVIRPKTSSGVLLRASMIGFGSGVAILAVIGLIYLGVTRFSRQKIRGSKTEVLELRLDKPN